MPPKSISQQYVKLDPIDHVLIRPDTYVGAANPVEEVRHVLDSESGRIIERNIRYTPALYKVFDEILVNAVDNKQRDPNMSVIRVTINPEECMLSVFNDGKGIPVEIHEIHHCYVPDLIFGQLLTGSNYDDKEQKVVGQSCCLSACLVPDASSGCCYIHMSIRPFQGKGKGSEA